MVRRKHVRVVDRWTAFFHVTGVATPLGFPLVLAIQPNFAMAVLMPDWPWVALGIAPGRDDAAKNRSASIR